ncbi:tripartite tricarboxylate transporter TctB family protein [Devosia sp. YIM 151766]|uniref:tripartite tricarboxylate transporter TctB family protein n=1 Tax=Devosia sp. YIM 151766 TaxID=3017325 RepID=UPI00255C3313|nr:tripartite tricarboxylate transporter TctB family protein [Devosia sp. YIM 151766]WIY53178.1 tripartite tricarboxylate transporter TctB family protein [Devosia sp. YIM 151766]
MPLHRPREREFDMKLSSKTGDIAGGVITIGIGVFFLIYSFSYSAGELVRMGPAYFPRIIAIAVIGLGIVVIATARKSAQSDDDAVRLISLDLSSAVKLAAGLAAFAAIIEVFGFVPAVFVAALAASLARGEGSLLSKLVICAAITAAVTVLNVLVFRAPVPLIGWF